MKLQIFRYTEDIKEQAKTKTDPQPWLHFAIFNEAYVIFVWDERTVIEDGKFPEDSLINPVYANDSHEELKGSGKIVDMFNEAMQQWREGNRKQNPIDLAVKWGKASDIKKGDLIYYPAEDSKDAYKVLETAFAAMNNTRVKQIQVKSVKSEVISVITFVKNDEVGFITDKAAFTKATKVKL